LENNTHAQEDYYADLKGEEVQSFAREAASWALAGQVPTRSRDGAWEVATVAGGCFWGTELHFQRVPGVVATCVGYTRGGVDKPSYGQVCSGTSGHTEALQLTFDPAVVSYADLCEKLLSTVDAAVLNRVGNDRGTQYRHGLYPHSPAQRAVAEQCVAAEQVRLGGPPCVTEVADAVVFWPAEPRHQRYLERGGQSAAKECAERVRCYG
jgi:peptide-methionine (S)-S-oxide reductase